MLDATRRPSRASLLCGDATASAVVLELSGQRAALRSAVSLACDQDVVLRLYWSEGEQTTLPCRVCATAADGDGYGSVAHVEVRSVEGDWQPFLDYLGGPLALPAA